MSALPRPNRAAIIATIVIFAAAVAILFAMDRPPICECGAVKLWHGTVQSSENSQHITDWYSPSHFIHGMIMYGLAWALWVRLPEFLSGGGFFSGAVGTSVPPLRHRPTPPPGHPRDYPDRVAGRGRGPVPPQAEGWIENESGTAPSRRLDNKTLSTKTKLANLLRSVAPWALPLAVALEAAWEISENTQTVIDRYREVTISWGYSGDSIVNSAFDIGWMVAGFLLAARIPWKVGAALAVFLELLALYAIRDNLALNVLMLFWPIEAVAQWQGMG